MQPLIFNPNRCRTRKGQTLIIFALSLVVLCGLVGFAVDSGIAYARRARLNTAVDAGAVVGTRYLGREDPDMRRLIHQAVLANDPGAILDRNTDISIQKILDANGLPIKVIIGVTARAIQPLTFMRVIMGNQSTIVSANAESVRFPIAMALIIDRSGSMTGNGGSTTIPATIPQFLSNFVPGFDTVGIYSYSWTTVRELPFCTNFQSQAMQNLFNGSSSRIQFEGYTSPADCLRMAMQDMEQLQAYNEKGVKKIVVFMTDGLFNTFRTRPPDVMGAMSKPAPNRDQTWWDENYMSDDPLYGSTAQWGTDGGSVGPLPSLSGPSDDFSTQGGGFTCIYTNSSGRGVLFRNLDAMINESRNLMFPGIGITQRFVFAHPSGGGRTYTNAYLVAAKQNSASGYGEGVSINESSSSRISLINPEFKYEDVGLPGDDSIARFRNNLRFRSAANGNWKSITGDNIRAEAREHALRYCDVARKTRTDNRRVTIFTIGFGSDSQLDVDVLMKMANLSPSDRNAPYTAVDSNEPFDETFGFTLARNSDELQRTYIALGIYLATRLTK